MESFKKITDKQFAKFSLAEKRVVIAQDVLAQLKAKFYIAKKGNYIFYIDRLEGVKYSADIKKNYAKIKSCTVCALGACLMSITKFENKLTFSDADLFFPGETNCQAKRIANKKAKSLFASLFSAEQLLLIENAFEGVSGGTRVGKELFYKNLSSEQKDACTQFYNQYQVISNRLKAIMENIIKNKGTFILPNNK